MECNSINSLAFEGLVSTFFLCLFFREYCQHWSQRIGPCTFQALVQSDTFIFRGKSFTLEMFVKRKCLLLHSLKQNHFFLSSLWSFATTTIFNRCGVYLSMHLVCVCVCVFTVVFLLDPISAKSIKRGKKSKKVAPSGGDTAWRGPDQTRHRGGLAVQTDSAAQTKSCAVCLWRTCV